jgi:hypothetical protein
VRKFPILASLPLLAALVHTVPAPATPVRGPGAVIAAVQGMLQAVDRGDRAGLEQAFSRLHDGEGVVCGFDADGAMKNLKEECNLVFQDVAADGSPLVRTDRKAAVDALLEQVGGKDRALRTTLKKMRADCPGPGCSWGSVEFERTFLRDGREVTVPMRATVLVRYQSEEQRMRIFLWHAASVAVTVTAKKG